MGYGAFATIIGLLLLRHTIPLLNLGNLKRDSMRGPPNNRKKKNISKEKKLTNISGLDRLYTPKLVGKQIMLRYSRVEYIYLFFKIF